MFNQSSLLETENYSCAQIFFYYTVYSNGVTGLLGFLANLVCIVVLASPSLLNTKRSGNMFKYLLMKAIMDGVVLAGRTASPFINCHTCFSFSASYGIKLALLIKEHYLKLTFLLCSMLYELMANLDRYLMLTKRFESFHNSNNCFKVICVAIILLSHLCYVFKFLTLDIAKRERADNSTEYYLAEKATTFNEYYGLAQSVFRDIVCVVLLIILNVLIIINMRKLLQKKQSLAGHQSQSRLDPNSSRTSRAQINLTRLILVTSLITLFSRFPVILKYLPVKAINSNLCILIAVESLYELSVSINLLVYIQFNRRFRKRLQFMVFETLGKIGLKTKRLAYLHTIYSKSD